MIDTATVEGILKEFLQDPIRMYALRVRSTPKFSLIEIDLDNLEDPRGAVQISVCEELSRKLQVRLDTEFPSVNYTLQVASAGAERQLRLPSDLYRFKELPVKLWLKEGIVRTNPGIYRITEVSENQVKLEELKKGKKIPEVLVLTPGDIIKGNLYIVY